MACVRDDEDDRILLKRQRVRKQMALILQLIQNPSLINHYAQFANQNINARGFLSKAGTISCGGDLETKQDFIPQSSGDVVEDVTKIC